MLARLRHRFRLTRTTVVLLIVIFTLGFNLLTFAFVPLANLMLAATQRLAIQTTLAAASELAAARDGEKAARSRSDSLRRELDAERRRAAQLDMDHKASEARIKQLQADVDVNKHKAAKFDTAVGRIDGLTERIVRRAGRNAARNLAAMPLESVPVVGALTIVSVTALEVYDACQTTIEMEELRRLANLPRVDSSTIQEACAKIPTLGGLDDLTIAQCREHESKVLAELGPEAAAPIKHKCDCLELPDGCLGEDTETVRLPPPEPELP